eukprot:62828_1
MYAQWLRSKYGDKHERWRRHVPEASLSINTQQLIKQKKLTWNDISNAIKHELSEQIAASFIEIVSSKSAAQKQVSNTSDLTEQLLDKLKRTKKTSKNEIDYIRQVIQRAIKSQSKKRGYSKQLSQSSFVSIGTNNKLSVSLLNDIYSVHNAFLFANYQFQQYSKQQFIQDITNNNYLKHKQINIPQITQQNTNSINLFPQFIIADDMYEIWQLFFGASFFVNKIIAHMHHSYSQFTLKMVVIPTKVISIYQTKIFSHSVLDVGHYFYWNKIGIDYNLHTLSSLLCHDVSSELETQFKIIKGRQKTITDLLVVIDRRSTNLHRNKNDIYITAPNTDLNELCPELNQNYFISLQFTVDRYRSKCHLFYGLNQSQRMRFYPEHLLSVIPRLFAKNYTLNQYHRVQQLFHDKYKHGFALNLDDSTFNKYYKIVTKWTHISVNYDRHSSVHARKEEYEFKDVEYYKMNKMTKECSSDDKIVASECPFIEHIVDSLILFQDYEFKINRKNDMKFNLHYLIKSYNHIISAHSFCSNKDDRQEIQNYMQTKIEKCPKKQKCTLIQKHSFRKREEVGVNKNNKQPRAANNSDILINILSSSLISLHCYLLHDGNTLFRLNRMDNRAAKTRFGTKVSPLQFNDEMDGLFEIITKVAKNSKTILYMTKWLKNEHYDWESIIYDLQEPYASQSNIYLSLKQYNSEFIFSLLQKQFNNTSAGSNDSHHINKINFGICVLNWFEYGQEPNYRSFYDEILNNKFTTITADLFEEYKNECLLQLNLISNPYKYTLNELLSLKLYTDTNQLCSLFRQSHWDKNEMFNMKQEFFWWALNIYKTSLYHACPLPRFDASQFEPMSLYHGINQVLTLSARMPKYHGPVSTTLVDTVAHQFSNETGLMWAIKTTYNNPLNFIKGIDVTRISCHKRESEILLVGQYLYVSQTIDFSDNETKVDHLLYKLTIYEDRIVDKRVFWNQMGFQLNNDLLSVIEQRPLLKYTKYVENGKQKTILHRLVEELNAKQFKDKYQILLFGVLLKEKPLIIDSLFKREKENEYNNDGAIQIYSRSTIKIESTGEISNIYDDSDRYIDDVHDDYEGLICLISSNNILIDGTLTSHINDANGMIALFADNNVILNGKLRCGRNGKILICCKSFQQNNKNGIANDTTLIKADINNQTRSSTYWQNQWFFLPSFVWETDGRLTKQIQLEIYQHKGHIYKGEMFSPQKLIDDVVDTYYEGGKLIIFRIKHGLFHPTKIQIRNAANSKSAIRTISLFIGSTDNNGNKWYPLAKKIQLHNDHNRKQKFAVELDFKNDKTQVDYFVLSNNLNLIKMEIRENYGSEYSNVFYEFTLFGRRYEKQKFSMLKSNDLTINYSKPKTEKEKKKKKNKPLK